MSVREVYFDDNVFITTSIATIFGVSYPVGAISSLRVETIESRAREAASVMTSLGMGALALFAALAAAQYVYGPPSLNPITGALGVAGLWLVAKGRAPRMAPTRYVLLVTASGGERAAMESRDLAYIEHIRAAIEHAIQSR